MKHIVLGDQKAWLEDAADPEPEGDQVVVRVMATPICGSDMHAFRGEGEHRGGGHEGVGQVVAVDDPRWLKIGDRVVMNPSSACGRCRLCLTGDFIQCRNGPGSMGHFAELVRKQEWICPILPDDISCELGALLGCALCPAWDALKNMKVGPSDHLLVTGLGPVGLGAVALGRYRNAEVIAFDPEPWRRDRAKQIGADHVLEGDGEQLRGQIKELTEGWGTEKAIDCSGHPDAERLCIDVAAVRGKVTFVGENPGPLEISPSAMIRRSLEVRASWHFNILDTPHLITFLRRFEKAALLISHNFSFDQCQEAFDTFASRKAAKVLLGP